MRIRLVRVQYMPKNLEPAVLYVSEEFGTAAHLCACGCGRKIRTPLGPTEWSVTETDEGPSLTPSIGNWQQPCRSHYWIARGQVRWAGAWSEERIEAGRREEVARREEQFRAREEPGIEREQPIPTAGPSQPERVGFFTRLWAWLKRWFSSLGK